MTPEHDPIAELRPLLDALCDETITPEQLARLEELVLMHPAAESFYIQFMSFHADMIGHVAGLPEAPIGEHANPTAAPPAAPKPARSSPPPGTREDTVMAEPSTTTPRRARTRWLLAASVLLALGGVAGYQAYDYSAKAGARREAQADLRLKQEEYARHLAEQNAARTAAVAALKPLQEAERKVAEEFRAAWQTARKAIEDREFTVRLTGPTHVQPGAPNKWQIETMRHGKIGRPEKMEVVVKDSKDTEVYRKTHDKPVGAATLELPTSVWEKVKPGADLFLEVSAFTTDPRKAPVVDRLPLARPVFVTHLVTDKPLYKPGEVIRFRSLTLDRSSLRAPENDLVLKFRLRDPSDAVVPLDEGNGRVVENLKPVAGPDKKPLRGIGVGEYALSADAPGGEYKLDLFEVNAGKETLLETRKFIVNKYVPDTFEKKLEFDGKSYGAGEFVQARIEVTRTAGGPMKAARANVVASIEGKPFHEQAGATFNIMTDANGPKAVLDVRFKLPADIFEKAAKGAAPNATLSVNIQDGSDAEAIVRPIALVTKTLTVDFFPEGGELVENVPGRVYFMVRTPQGKPADLKGTITDGTTVVAQAETVTDAENPGVNRGHGSFLLTPKPGAKYFLQIATPGGIVPPTPEGFALPTAKADGIALTALDAVTPRGGAVRVKVQTAQGPKTLHVGAYVRERLIAQQKVTVQANTPLEVSLKGDEAAGGVTRVTVFEEAQGEGPGQVSLVPRAERLVFRGSGEHLALSVAPDKLRYAPSDKVKLDITSVNEKNATTPAVLLVAVVNRSVITMADNKTDRLMPTHFLLSGEVKHPAELEHADFLLTDHPNAAKALDLLLGTQGWRRFAEQDIAPANPNDRPDIDRLLASHGQRPPAAPVEFIRLEEQRVSAEFRPRLDQASLARAGGELKVQSTAASDTPATSTARSALSVAKSLTDQADAALTNIEDRLRAYGVWIAGGLVAIAVFVGLFFVFRSVIASGSDEPVGRARPALAAAGVLFVLVGGAYLVNRGLDGFAAKKAAMADAQASARMEAGGREMAGAEKNFAPGGPRGGAGAMPPMMPPGGGMGPPAGVGLPGQKSDPKTGADPKPKSANAEDKLQGILNKKPAQAVASVASLADAEKKVLRGSLRDRAVRSADEARPMDFRFPAGEPAMGMPPFGGQPGSMDALEPLDMQGEGFNPITPFFTREYAHQRDPALGDVRADFTETVYWNPVLVTPESGKATVEFQLSDDIARYQVLVAGHTPDGRIGAVTHTIEARKPFSLDPKMPLEISHTDTIDVPVRATNDSDVRRNISYAVTASGFRTDGKLADVFDLAPNGKGRKIVRLTSDKLQGDAGLLIEGTSVPVAEKDSIARTIRVVPDGFPGVGSYSDMIEGRARGTVTLPKDAVAGSLKVRLEVYPTSMADLVNGLDGLLREPSGCFEQTSTSNYPNTLILEYMNQTNQTNPTAAARAKALLDKGYARLTSFECPDTPTRARQGFEWFGAADMQHEALTAYGLLQFKDMSRVHGGVDPKLLKRTQDFLMSRRDGTGGFKSARAGYHSWSASKPTFNAYIVWALVESDPDDADRLDLKKEIAWLKTEALDANSVGGKDSYFVALVANIMLVRGERETGHKLLDRLKEKHFKDGAVTGASTSITQSRGRDLEIETTAIAMLGWLRANDPSYTTTVKAATKWLSQQRGGYGGFGSTQSTIMALKALTLYAKKAAHPAESGTITVTVGGKAVATRPFTEKDVEVIGMDIEKAEGIFKFGETTDVEITTTGKQPYPFALSYTYTTLTPISAEKCAVRVATKLAKTEANEGDTVPMAVTLDNLKKEGHGMAVAIVGIPAGMKVPTDMKQLTDLREKGTISYFEIRGRELVLYWRELMPEQKVALSVDLVCDVPGTYRGPASRAYLYYNADHKHWVEPLSVKIAPLAGE